MCPSRTARGPAGRHWPDRAVCGSGCSVVCAGFDKANPRVRISRKAVGKNAASRAVTDDDVVEHGLSENSFHEPDKSFHPFCIGWKDQRQGGEVLCQYGALVAEGAKPVVPVRRADAGGVHSTKRQTGVGKLGHRQIDAYTAGTGGGDDLVYPRALPVEYIKALAVWVLH